MEHLQAALKKLAHTPTFSWEVLLIDFGKHECEEMQKMAGVRYSHNPLAGFCRNFNSGKALAFFTNCQYYFFLNDDTAIHEDFVVEGVKFMERHPNAGFVGGTSQLGGWNESLDRLRIPIPQPGAIEITNFSYLQWEFSAGMYRMSALEEIGKMDEDVDASGLGVLADNDILLRTIKKGWKCYRSSNITFWHSKGQTQKDYRTPSMGMDDPIRMAALKYLKHKWGVDFTQPFDINDTFDTPWNLKEK